MRWTIENEELLLSLYFDVKTRYEKKMKKDVERCKWIAEKLRDEADLEVSCKQIKDKICSIKKTGNSKMKMFVLPLVNRRYKTGAAVDEDSADQLDWEDILKRAKWPLLRTYYELFKAHPTMGVALSLDTASGSETESGSASSETVQPQGMAAASTASAAVHGGADSWSRSSDEEDAAAIPDAPAVEDLEDNDPDGDDEDDEDDEDDDDQEEERRHVAEDEDNGPVRPVVGHCSRPPRQRRHTPVRAAALPSRVARSQQAVVSPQQQQFLSGLGEIMNTQSQNMLAIQVIYHYHNLSFILPVYRQAPRHCKCRLSILLLAGNESTLCACME